MVRPDPRLGVSRLITIRHRQIPASEDRSNHLDDRYRESETRLPCRMEVAGHRSIPEMPALPPLFSYKRGDPGERGTIPPPSHTSYPKGVFVTGGLSDPPGEFLADTTGDQLGRGLNGDPGQALTHPHFSCDLGDEFHNRTNGVLEPSPTRRSSFNDLSQSPLSIGSLLSYYGNNPLTENTSTNGSPRIGLEHEGLKTVDIKLCNANTNAVCAFFAPPYIPC